MDVGCHQLMIDGWAGSSGPYKVAITCPGSSATMPAISPPPPPPPRPPLTPLSPLPPPPPPRPPLTPLSPPPPPPPPLTPLSPLAVDELFAAPDSPSRRRQLSHLCDNVPPMPSSTNYPERYGCNYCAWQNCPASKNCYCNGACSTGCANTNSPPPPYEDLTYEHVDVAEPEFGSGSLIGRRLSHSTRKMPPPPSPAPPPPPVSSATIEAGSRTCTEEKNAYCSNWGYAQKLSSRSVSQCRTLCTSRQTCSGGYYDATEQKCYLMGSQQQGRKHVPGKLIRAGV